MNEINTTTPHIKYIPSSYDEDIFNYRVWFTLDGKFNTLEMDSTATDLHSVKYEACDCIGCEEKDIWMVELLYHLTNESQHVHTTIYIPVEYMYNENMFLFYRGFSKDYAVKIYTKP